MGAAAAAGKGVVKFLKFIFMNLLPGILALVLSTVTNSLIMGVVLVRFVTMSVLKTTSTAVEFAGETLVNSIAFVRDTVFSILTFVVQTVVNSITYILNQFLMVWTLLIRVVSVVLGETCFLTKSLFGSVVDLVKDIGLIGKAFTKGIKAMNPVMKDQVDDLKGGFTTIKDVVKASVGSLKETLVYIVKGDENKFSDGLVPNVFTELFSVLPLSFDLSKLILSGTVDISKSALGAISGSFKELTSLEGISLGCSGK